MVGNGGAVNPAAKHRMTLGVDSTPGGVVGGKRKEDEGIEIDGEVAEGSATVGGIGLAKMETNVILVVGNEGVTVMAIMCNLLLRNLALRRLWTRRCHLIECVHDEFLCLSYRASLVHTRSQQQAKPKHTHCCTACAR